MAVLGPKVTTNFVTLYKKRILTGFIWLSAIGCFFLGSIGLAQVSSFPEIMDQYAYEFVLNSCQDLTHAGSEHFLSRTKQLTLDISTETIKKEFLNLGPGERLGISKQLNQLLNSDGYYQGLRECFPENTRSQNIYTAKLIALDLGGTLESAILLVASGKAITKAFSWTTKKLGWRIFKSKLLKSTAIASFIGVSGYSAYSEDQKNTRDRESLRQYLLDQEIKTLHEIRKEYSSYLKYEVRLQENASEEVFETTSFLITHTTLTLQTLCASTQSFMDRDSHDFKDINTNICSQFRDD